MKGSLKEYYKFCKMFRFCEGYKGSVVRTVPRDCEGSARGVIVRGSGRCLAF